MREKARKNFNLNKFYQVTAKKFACLSFSDVKYLDVKMNENDVCCLFLIFSINFQLPYHMLQGEVITFALKLSHCLRDKLALLTRLPQKRHGPDPSCSHTIRPHLTQLEISLCFVAWHSQECLPVGKKNIYMYV